MVVVAGWGRGWWGCEGESVRESQRGMEGREGKRTNEGVWRANQDDRVGKRMIYT